MLGGEPWPQTIDDAIKNRTFRLLALMSVHSLHKPKPTGERVLAQRLAQQRNIPDFLIPLKIDDVELDWLTTTISYVPFNRGWAEGFRQLLEKLESISAPKTLPDAPALAATTFPSGEDLINSDGENIRANVMRVQEIPAALRVFEIDEQVTDQQRSNLEGAWPFYRINSRIAVAFIAPPAEFKDTVRMTKEQYSWADYDTVYRVRTRDIVTNLILRTLGVRLLHAGCQMHPKRNGIYYLPENMTQDGWLRFVDYEGQPRRLKIRGKATFLRPAKPREVNHHHFAFRLKLGRGLDRFFWIQVTPTLFFFDDVGIPITDKRVGPRRRRVTKMWWNAKWHNRLLAAGQLLLGLQEKSNDGVRLDTGLLVLEAPLGLNESTLIEPDKSVLAEEGVPEENEFSLEEEGAGEETDE